jgi:hypothetical protein
VVGIVGSASNGGFKTHAGVDVMGHRLADEVGTLGHVWMIAVVFFPASSWIA